jgi:hypothetical protein
MELTEREPIVGRQPARSARPCGASKRQRARAGRGRVRLSSGQKQSGGRRSLAPRLTVGIDRVLAAARSVPALFAQCNLICVTQRRTAGRSEHLPSALVRAVDDTMSRSLSKRMVLYLDVWMTG